MGGGLVPTTTARAWPPGDRHRRRSTSPAASSSPRRCSTSSRPDDPPSTTSCMRIPVAAVGGYGVSAYGLHGGLVRRRRPPPRSSASAASPASPTQATARAGNVSGMAGVALWPRVGHRLARLADETSSSPGPRRRWRARLRHRAARRSDVAPADRRRLPLARRLSPPSSPPSPTISATASARDVRRRPHDVDRLATVIGGATATGSLVAFGKLNENLSSAALSLPGRDQMNIAAALGMLAAWSSSWPTSHTSNIAALGACSPSRAASAGT